jgi:hypothetical protein
MVWLVIIAVFAWLICTGAEGCYRGERGHDDQPRPPRPHALR